MKKLLLIPLLFAFAVQADPRIEEECHVPVNANNTDIEVKMQNCNGEIYVKANGNADGRFYWEQESKWPAARLNFKNVSIRGAAAPAKQYKGFTKATDGSRCVMVTRDYNNGQYNYTEYTTANWALTVRQRKDDGEIKTVYSLKCTNGQQ